MQSTRWRKPVGDCGGITDLIGRHYLRVKRPHAEATFDVIVHAYREVGTSLETSLEIHHCLFFGGKKKVVRITFETFII